MGKKEKREGREEGKMVEGRRGEGEREGSEYIGRDLEIHMAAMTGIHP